MNTEKTSLEPQNQPSCLGAVISRLLLTTKINLYVRHYRRKSKRNC
jgi:hypothetical protein